MILHTLKKNKALMPIGDLIVRMEDYAFAKSLIVALNPLNEIGIIRSVNQELRKPLQLSDFVRPDEPKEKNYHTSQLSYGAAQNNWIKALKEWENWEPLFSVWKGKDGKYEGLAKEDLTLFVTENEFLLFKGSQNILKVSNPTREDFLKACKDNNIEL
jgi:hypothetical protein